MTKTNVAYGLPSLTNEYESPFVNWLKISRPFTKGFTAAYEEIEPYLDADLQATEMPPGWTVIQSSLGFAFADPTLIQGPWVFLYEGEGTVTVSGFGIVITDDETPGRIEFTNPDSSGINIAITETDPNENGNYIKLKALFLASEETLYDTDVIYRPSWLNAYRDADTIRFMDMMQTNWSTQSEWADRPTMSMWTWGGGVFGWPNIGTPIEAMVALSNELEPRVSWYCMPHLATDDYCTQFATYIRDNQTPSIITVPEYSNELWNVVFGQTAWSQEQAELLWGTSQVAGDEPGTFDYQAMRATQVAKIWDDVFDEEAITRVAHYLGVQTGNAYWIDRQISAIVANTAGWPGGVALDPLNYFSALNRPAGGGIACTTYFGNNGVLVGTDLPAYLATHTNEETAQWFTDQLMDIGVEQSIPYVTTGWVNQRTMLNTHGPRGVAVQMVLYEGGQHFHIVNSEFLVWYVRTVWCAYLYDQSWTAFESVVEGRRILDGPYMHLSLAGPNGLGGSWSIIDHVGDMTERYRVSLLRSRGLPWDENNTGRIGITAL
jgi:hypothetical protein